MTDGLDDLRARIKSLEAQDERVNKLITDGFTRLEQLLNREIDKLKDEQLTSLREENRRLADDQRRIWDHIHRKDEADALRLGQNTGERQTFGKVSHIISGLIGGVVTLATGLLAWWGSSHPPTHP